jgi:hypothetical protein
MARTYHTEDEARELSCPMTFGTGQHGRCLASHCMAWRQSTRTAEDLNFGTCGLVRFAPDRDPWEE